MTMQGKGQKSSDPKVKEGWKLPDVTGLGPFAAQDAINKAVARDVQGVFKGKTVEQLDMLQKSIEQKLKERAEGVDIGYWESLLSQLKAHSARGRLRDKH